MLNYRGELDLEDLIKLFVEHISSEVEETTYFSPKVGRSIYFKVAGGHPIECRPTKQCTRTPPDTLSFPRTQTPASDNEQSPPVWLCECDQGKYN